LKIYDRPISLSLTLETSLSIDSNFALTAGCCNRSLYSDSVAKIAELMMYHVMCWHMPKQRQK